MTSIDFYFDTVCPFSWITSRWLLQISEHRGVNINWRQFSLALKNNSLEPGGDKSTHSQSHISSHKIHRVIRQISQKHDIPLIDLYSEFGIRHHILEKPLDAQMINEVLESKSLPLKLAKAADDTNLDKYLQSEIAEATKVAGADIGVPTIVFTGTDGSRLGYFGPVLNELPATLEESLNIWDGLEKLATAPSFYEIKRARPSGPNVFSAARC